MLKAFSLLLHLSLLLFVTHCDKAKDKDRVGLIEGEKTLVVANEFPENAALNIYTN